MTTRRVLRCFWVSSFAAALLLACSPLRGQELLGREISAYGWAVTTGAFGVADDDSTLEIGLEHRFRPFALGRGVLAPALGVALTERESVWLYGGLRWDLPLSEHWIATPQFAMALYDDGNGKDLGGFIEFRSGIEIAYRFDGGSRLGVLLYHLSNGGLFARNPGVESLVLTWSFGR